MMFANHAACILSRSNFLCCNNRQGEEGNRQNKTSVTNSKLLQVYFLEISSISQSSSGVFFVEQSNCLLVLFHWGCSSITIPKD